VHCQGTVTPDLCASPVRPAGLSEVMETSRCCRNHICNLKSLTSAYRLLVTQHWGHTPSSCDCHFRGRRGARSASARLQAVTNQKLPSWLVPLLGPFHPHRATRSHADEDGPIQPFTGQCITLVTVAAKVTPGPSAVMALLLANWQQATNNFNV